MASSTIVTVPHGGRLANQMIQHLFGRESWLRKSKLLFAHWRGDLHTLTASYTQGYTRAVANTHLRTLWTSSLRFRIR